MHREHRGRGKTYIFIHYMYNHLSRAVGDAPDSAREAELYSVSFRITPSVVCV